MADSLNFFAYYRPKNSPTAIPCERSYKEDWQTASAGDDVGTISCNGTAYLLKKASGDKVFLTKSGEETTDIIGTFGKEDSIYIGIDETESATPIIFKTKTALLAYFSENRK